MVDEALKDYRRSEKLWGDTLSVLEAADLRVINLECAITTHENPWSRTPKTFHFRAGPSRAVSVLRAARIDACSLANNHTLDFEEEGLLDSAIVFAPSDDAIGTPVLGATSRRPLVRLSSAGLTQRKSPYWLSPTMNLLSPLE